MSVLNWNYMLGFKGPGAFLQVVKALLKFSLLSELGLNAWTHWFAREVHEKHNPLIFS